MIRKYIAALFMIVFSSCALFAYTDEFYQTSINREYVSLISSIKNNNDEAVILNNYNAYINSGITPVERARIEYHIARYYRDAKKKDIARDHISMMRNLIDSIDKSTISDFENKVLEIEYYSAKYYVDKKISDGMENSNLTKELYSLYPDDVFSIMTEAWRLIYTPVIAGGSPKKAIKLLSSLLKGYEENLSPLDRYSTYCALAIASYNRDDFSDADDYFNKAFAYYKNENDIVECYNDNLKQLMKTDD